jgi:hypothetical protein
MLGIDRKIADVSQKVDRVEGALDSLKHLKDQISELTAVLSAARDSTITSPNSAVR